MLCSRQVAVDNRNKQKAHNIKKCSKTIKYPVTVLALFNMFYVNYVIGPCCVERNQSEWMRYQNKLKA